jgi:hypothetical protein
MAVNIIMALNRFSFKRIIGRKGFTYMLVSSLLIVVLLGIFFAASRYRYEDQEKVYQVRLRAMDDFVKSFNSDIHRATYIASFRSLVALEDSVTTQGYYLSDMNRSFKETFYYGTINGSSSVIMENSSFQDYVLRVSEIAQSVGMNVKVNVTDILLSQSNPWSIDVEVHMRINISDNSRLAEWVMNNSYKTNIPIYNLRDPLYSKNTLNRVPNTIRKLNTSVLVSGVDTTKLVDLISGSYYITSTSAPNFLMRFEGRTAPDANGIESIVNIRTLSDQDIAVDYNRIKVDYIYFNDIENYSKICNVTNIPSAYYFVIPSNSTALYQVQGLNYSSSCP